MDYSIANAVARNTQHIRNLYINSNRCEWDAAVNGTQENLDKLAKARTDWMTFWADPDEFKQFRDWDRSKAAGSDNSLGSLGG